MSLDIHCQQNDELVEYYSDKKNCFADICQARKAFGSTETTVEQYDAMEKGLGIMLLWCPEEIRGIVEATLFEAEARRPYFNFDY